MKYNIRNPADKKKVIDKIDQLSYSDGWQVEITKFKERKTLPQLKTIHMHIRETQDFFRDSAGKFYTDDQLKDWIKSLFGIVEIYETPTGKRKRYKSFADYTCEEMSKLIDDYMNYCVSELGLYLTLPGREDI